MMSLGAYGYILYNECQNLVERIIERFISLRDICSSDSSDVVLYI